MSHSFESAVEGVNKDSSWREKLSCRSLISLRHASKWQKYIPAMKWLAMRFNDVDRERRKIVGPDQSAAEWAVRNGCKIRWKGHAEYTSNYDEVVHNPGGSFDRKLEALYADEAAVNWAGMQHLEDCEHFVEAHFLRCWTVDDECIGMLLQYAPHLEKLYIDDCPITNDVSIPLSKHSALRYLSIKNVTPKITGQKIKAQPNYIYERIKTHNPDCKIEFEYQKLDPILEDMGATSRKRGF